MRNSIILSCPIIVFVIVRSKPEEKLFQTWNTVIKLPIVCHTYIRLYTICRTHTEYLAVKLYSCLYSCPKLILKSFIEFIHSQLKLEFYYLPLRITTVMTYKCIWIKSEFHICLTQWLARNKLPSIAWNQYSHNTW